MKMHKTIITILMLLFLSLLGGCGFGAVTYSELTDVEVFQNVPILEVEGTITSTADDYGDGNYVVRIDGTTKSDYDAYLELLEKESFEKYVDNGEGFDGSIYAATYTKEDLVLQVLQVEKANRTYLCAGKDNSLSEHLFYKDEYVANNIDGAKTKLHQVELYWYGSSFIIQLKDGTFIVNDGGTSYDAPYLFDYLEELAPEGQKPVVTAWVISHFHMDHMGWVDTVNSNFADYDNRIYVEGFYFNEPSQEVIAQEGKQQEVTSFKTMATKMKTTDGNKPEIYRLHTGQRYYFNDITMDVALSQEQILFNDYEDGFNESSTWLMYTIDGQKVLIGGDSGPAGMKVMMEAYSQEYLTMDFYSALHHGWNVRADFSDYCTMDIVMYTEPTVVTSGSNTILLDKAKESYSFQNGTMVYTFPYTEGTAECLGNNQWLYHIGQIKPTGR